MFLGMLFENGDSNEGVQAVLNVLHPYIPYGDIEKHGDSRCC